MRARSWLGPTLSVLLLCGCEELLLPPSEAQRWTFAVPRGAVWSWVVLWSEELWVGVANARLEPGP